MKRVLLLVATLAVLAVPRPAQALAILYLPEDLVDAVAGEDLWRYHYFLSGEPFLTDHGFSVAFDPLLYSSLEDLPPAVDAAWDLVSFQPDLLLSSAGLYDGLALADDATMAHAFTVSFIWLGTQGSAPGSQPFTLNQYDVNGNISILEEGQTQPFEEPLPIPEPSTLLLLGTGLALATRSRRRVQR